ncbi:MAG: T9SS type A sorting domain-containing protein [Candidatus Marinimicrobia bacterium]|nr:T9SS type A sorting domain-containing protein [Candidatus Neomarinimicrobiota bacterium]
MMKRVIISLSFLLLFTMLHALPNAWINEIHYDNAGADQDEFVEVVVASPENYSLIDLHLYMYNGYDGTHYCLDCISEFTPGERIGPYQFYTWYHRGIQNDTEGMILVYHDTLVDIIAYEGSFTGTLPPAEGLVFPDVGVAETGSSPVTASIYLSGLPGSDWLYGTASTPGNKNPGQDFSEILTSVELAYFKASVSGGHILLSWKSESETENASYLLYRNGSVIRSVPAAGTQSAPQTYSCRDEKILPGRMYKYTLSAMNYGGREQALDSLHIRAGGIHEKTKPFQLHSPFPNPFNPESTFRVDIFSSTNLEISLFDLKGRKRKTVYRGMCENNSLEITLDLHDLPSGRYILDCSSKKYRETKTITLVK